MMEKNRPRGITRITSYSPFVALDEDNDILFSEEALNSDTYLVISTEDDKVKQYAANLVTSERIKLLEVHYMFSGPPNSSTILSVHMPQILSYCLKGVLVDIYYQEKKRGAPLADKLMDSFRRYVAARIGLDQHLRLQGKSGNINRGFLYFPEKSAIAESHAIVQTI